MAPTPFFSTLDQYADRPCLIVPQGKSWSYAEFLSLGDEIARSLGQTRQLVFIEGKICVATLAAYVGCLRAGHSVHLTDPEKGADLPGLIEAFQPHILITTQNEQWQAKRLHNTPLALHPELAILLSTSGSTGTRKLVKISRTNIDSNTRSIADYLKLQADDRALTVLKPHYSFGLSVINTHLLVGASLILSDLSVQDSAFWQFMQEYSPTNFSGVPYNFQMLSAMGADLSRYPSLRFVTQAGGRLSPDLVVKFARMSQKQGWLFYVMYGQTEASPRMSYLPPELAESYPDCIGVAVPGGTFKLLTETGEMTDAPGSEGELVYFGPNVMIGYAYGAQDLGTQEAIPYLLTGDLATLNERGLVRITGRKARFVKPFGVRTSLDEIEQQVETQGARIAVVGSDEKIVICSEATLDQEQLVAQLAARSQLPPSLFQVRVFGKLPLLSSGKTDYRTLTRLALGEKAGPLSKGEFIHLFIRNTIREASSLLLGNKGQWKSVEEIYAIHFPAKEISGSQSFVSLSGDSLNYVQVALALEDYLNQLPSNWHEKTIHELEALHAV